MATLAIGKDDGTYKTQIGKLFLSTQAQHSSLTDQTIPARDKAAATNQLMAQCVPRAISTHAQRLESPPIC
jgi:hypothetical protein